MYTHFFVPIDGSELSERTFVQSVGLASKLGARITGFVAEPMPPLPTESSGMTSYLRQAEDHRKRTEAHAHATLDRFAAHAAAAGVPFEGCFKRSDTVDNAIVATAVEHGCDLLVMTTHGRGALSELLFGSHTKSVISRTTLPVLVLH
jgi:nucleotide-binding universal stress UspA family protein